MKKMVATLLALAVLALSGCALAEQADPTAAPEATAETAATEAPAGESAGDSAGAAAEDTRPYYEMDQLGVRLYVDSDWEQYARNYDVTIAAKADYDDAGTLKSGLMVLLPQQYDNSDSSNVSFDVRGGIMAIAVQAEGAESAAATELEGYESSALGSAEGYEFTLYLNPAPDTSLLDEAGVTMVDTIRASLSAGAANSVLLSRPATVSELTALVGEFSTQDIYGAAVDRSVLSNAPYTLIDVWATSCPPCISEMPGLATLAKEYEGRVQFLGIVSDAIDEDTMELARSIVEQTGVGYSCIVPDSSLYTTLLSRIQYTPTKVIVDQNGQQVGDPIIGAQSEDALRAVLDALPAAE